MAAGARAVVLREKDLPRPRRRALGEAIVPLLAAVRGVLVVASDAVLAAELGAGVHLAAHDPPPGPGAAGGAGRSCHDLASLGAAAREGVAYATLSPIFPSASKPGYGPCLGIPGLREATAATRLPVYALGGVLPVNAGDCLRAGAAGVAVMGAVMASPSPERATRDLLDALDAAGPEA